jgi:hypothetical protein
MPTRPDSPSTEVHAITQRLWIDAAEDETEGWALALAWDRNRMLYLVCDESYPAPVWVEDSKIVAHKLHEPPRP